MDLTPARTARATRVYWLWAGEAGKWQHHLSIEDLQYSSSRPELQTSPISSRSVSQDTYVICVLIIVLPACGRHHQPLGGRRDERHLLAQRLGPHCGSEVGLGQRRRFRIHHCGQRRGWVHRRGERWRQK